MGSEIQMFPDLVLEGLKVGDKVDITYTAALLMNVEAAKPSK